MEKKLISSGSVFEREIAYSRAVVDGTYVFISGTTGFDYETMTIPENVVAQAEQCFQNIANVLAAAGSGFDQIVRVRYIVPNRSDFEPCWPVIQKYLHSSRPAATMMVAELLDPRIKIEIEVTARLDFKPE